MLYDDRKVTAHMGQTNNSHFTSWNSYLVNHYRCVWRLNWTCEPVASEGVWGWKWRDRIMIGLSAATLWLVCKGIQPVRAHSPSEENRSSAAVVRQTEVLRSSHSIGGTVLKSVHGLRYIWKSTTWKLWKSNAASIDDEVSARLAKKTKGWNYWLLFLLKGSSKWNTTRFNFRYCIVYNLY